jgi:hypothetical protein
MRSTLNFDLMRLLKRLPLWTAGLLLFLLLLVSLIPLDTYLPQTEQTLSSQLGAPMHIQRMRLGALPLPHLILEDSSLGTPDAQITATTVDIQPDWLALFQGNLVVKRIHLRGGAAHAEQIRKLIEHLSATQSDTGNFELHTLSFSDMQLLLPNHSIDSVEGDLRFAHNGPLERAWFGVDERKLTAVLLPQKPGGFNIKLQSENWTPAFWPQLTIKNLRGDGQLVTADSQLQFAGDIKLEGLDMKLARHNRKTALGVANIEGHLLLNSNEISLQPLKADFEGGALSGEFKLERATGLISGKFHTERIAMEPLLQKLFNQSRFSGSLDSDISFSLLPGDDLPIQKRLSFSAQYNIRHGMLKTIDLVEAARNPEQANSANGSTAFDTLNGLVKGGPTGYYFEPLRIASGLLDAEGGISIAPDMTLGGWLDADIKNTVGLVSMPMNVSGTVSEPIVRPSKSALAGAAVGTAVLGPLGTALGVKIGGFINRHMSNTPDKKPARKPTAPQ